MAYYGANPDINKYIEYATGLQGPFGTGQTAGQLTNMGLPTDHAYWQNRMSNDSTYGTNQTQTPAPTASPDMSQVTNNQGTIMGNQGAMAANQGTMMDNQSTMVGNQGTIMGNQGVLQSDIGAVGGMVGNMNQNIGTPAEQGQTLFGNMDALNTGQQGIFGDISTLTGNLGNFQNQFTNYTNDANSQRNTMGAQGLNQRGDILQEMQGMQPFLNRMDQALRANPGAFGPNGFNPAVFGSGIMGGGSAPQAAPVTPQATQAASAGLSSALNSGQIQMGPMGVQSIDPRDMV